MKIMRSQKVMKCICASGFVDHLERAGLKFFVQKWAGFFGVQQVHSKAS